VSRKITNRLASLLDPAKIATLKGDRPVNRRVNLITHWLEHARLTGGDAFMCAQLDEALRPYANEKLKTMVKVSVLHNRHRAMRLGCLVPAEMEKMKRGHSPIVQQGPYLGMKLWVDHVIPRALAPDLTACLPNLEFLPESLNRKKRDKLTARRHRELAALLRDAKVISAERHAQLCNPALFANAALTDTEIDTGTDTLANTMAAAPLNAHTGSETMAPAGNSGAPSSMMRMRSSDSTDPRLILVKVQDFTEQLEDWEQHSIHAMEKARFSTQHSAELVSRVSGVKIQALHRLQDDRVKVQRLDEDRRGWHEHVSKIQTHATEATQRAQNALSDARTGIELWEQKLSQAQAWLERALRAERAAEEQVHRSERQLQHAQSELDHARQKLNSARQRRQVVGHDRENKPIYGPIDTSSYERAVNVAESHLGWCQEQLNVARDILNEAVADRRAAGHRVGCCERALQLASDSATSAERAVVICRDAQATAARAGEELNRLDFLARSAATALTQANDAGTGMEAAAGLAETGLEAARTSLDNAEKLHSESRNASGKGRHEITWRMSKLRAFDAPLNF
jgi:DNA repair exonuclease SbcCD ATPase subunit